MFFIELIWISGRKEIIAEFKALVSSFPEKMGTMQGHLREYKETASNVHALRADVQSLSSILDRKVSRYVMHSCSLMQLALNWVLLVTGERMWNFICEIQRAGCWDTAVASCGTCFCFLICELSSSGGVAVLWNCCIQIFIRVKYYMNLLCYIDLYVYLCSSMCNWE